MTTIESTHAHKTRRVTPATPYRLLAIVLATLLLANPLAVFLISREAWIAVAVPTTSSMAMLWACSRRRWRLASAYLFNVIAVLSLFMHGEVILTYAFPDRVVQNLYTIEDGYYFNRPHLDQTFTGNEFSVRYRTNAQGFRIADSHDGAQIVDRADWLVIGDSFTQGAQVSFEELYTTLLNDRFPSKIVVNAGISGLGLGHELNYYQKAGYKLGADLVILQLSSFNDFMSVEPHKVSFSDRLMARSAFVRLLLENFKFTDPKQLPLGRWTEPFQSDLQGNLDFNVFFNRSSPVKERDLALVRTYLSRLRDAVEQEGARLLVVLLPTKEQVHPRHLNDVIHAYQLDPADLDMRRPNELLRSIATDLDIELLDLLERFQAAAADPFLNTDEHLSSQGHLIVADALKEHLASQHKSLVRALTPGWSAERYPMPSRNGGLLTYQALVAGSMELFISPLDLTEPRRLTFDDVDQSHAMLSRDNTQVVFTSGSAGSQRTEVVLMDLERHVSRVLTPEPHIYGAIPVFSKADLQIAYAEWLDIDGALTNPRIVVVDTVTGAKRYITRDERESWRPVFAHDDASVFYISKHSHSFDLFSYDLVSGVERRLTTTPFDEWDPQVSPDGQRLVYAAHKDGNWDLFLLNLASGAALRLTDTKGDEWDPSFSSDGSEILFAGKFGPREGLFSTPTPP